MDKKKVKELIEDATCKLNYFDEEQDNYEGLRMDIVKTLEQVVKELSKSDWISVEDGLPKIGTTVLVANKKYPNECNLDYREDPDGMCRDKYGFEDYYGVTHWKPIEKLEE